MKPELSGSNVLVVDDAPENLRLLATVLRRGGLVPRPVPSGKLAIEAALVDPPDLVLLDIRMPDMSGLDVCRWFKQDQRLQEIPVVFLSGMQDTDDKVEAFRIGGVDYITKPFHEQEVLARIETHLHLRRLQREIQTHNQFLEQRVAEQVKLITASQMATIFALAKLAEVRDDNTGRHIERVQRLVGMLAEKMRAMKVHVAKLSSAFIDTLQQVACLHDIGKVAIPDAILLKPGKLSPEEFAKMKEHCARGAETLAAVQRRFPENEFIRMGVEVARSHHEWWDGTGYPDGLAGKAIPLSARIVALADFYDALTSERCYHPARSHADACRMIEEGCGTHFDPHVVAAFEAMESEFEQTRRELHD